MKSEFRGKPPVFCVLSMSCFPANVGILGILDTSVFCKLRAINNPVEFKSTPHNQHFHLFPVPI